MPTPGGELPADEPCTGTAPAPPRPGGFWRRLLWFRPGAPVHNTAVVVAWIGFAGAIGGPLVTVGAPTVWSSLNNRGGNIPPRRVVSIVNPPGGITYAYRYPSLSSRHAKWRPIYREGDTIEVVCQIRDGEPVSMPGDGRPNYAVSAWDQLANGSWVPDLFTSLGHKRGPQPPPGIELCPEPTSVPVPAP